MDIYCATCQEPWESFHMLSDAVWDIWDGWDDSSSHLLVKRFLADPKKGLGPMLREDMADKGWVFGKTVICILECPCCHGQTDEDPEGVKARKEAMLEVEELMAGDLDGIISSLSRRNW